MNLPKIKVRFAIADQGIQRSQVWFASSNGSEVYVGPAADRFSKLSFHSSRICRYAFREDGAARPVIRGDRLMFKWQRPTTPPRGAGKAIRVAELAFPTDYLRSGTERTATKVRALKAAPPGHAVHIEMFFTYESKEYIDATYGRANGIIAYGLLPNGEAFVISSSVQRWENRDLIVAAGHDESPERRFTAEMPFGVSRLVSITVDSGAPTDGGFLSICELWGYSVEPGTPYVPLRSPVTLTRQVIRHLRSPDEFAGLPR
jgi:hypothetical protein